MDTWKEFEANELTHSATHHLFAIHEVGVAYGGWACVSDIARRLNITRGSVSINLRTLKKRGWVETDEHRLVRLSPKGLEVVHAVMAKRVIVKTFLRDVLGISESQADIDSCKIEHLIFANTPDHTASVWTTYRLPRGIEIGGGAQHVGNRFNKRRRPIGRLSMLEN